MYRKFFDLSEKPFNLTPDPDFLYLSRGHREALAHLTYGVEAKSGFVMITGEVGSGKTTLLRALIANLGDNVVLSQVTNTHVSYKELLELILRDFGLTAEGLGTASLLSNLNDFLIERFREGRSCVLLVDEAQDLGVSSLEGVRMLSNLETEKAKLLHIILVGQPGLRTLIESPELEQLRQRTTVRYHLGALTPGEVAEYVRHRLSKVCRDPEKAPVFPEEVIPAIHVATGGIPRLINVLCDAALLHAYVAETRIIGDAIVAEVAAQISRDQQGKAPPPEPATRDADAELRAKVAALEARFDSVTVQAVREPVPGPGPGRTAERAGYLAKKEGDLRSRELEVARRVADVEKREEEFRERVTQLKGEWKKRLDQLERVRRETVGGAVRFPALRVHAYDPDPRIQNALAEAFEASRIDAEVHRDYRAFSEALRDGSRSGWFTVAVLGAEQDDSSNVERVARISEELPHVPRIYLSDLDLSTLRRRIFAAGANYFLEKPNGRAGSFTTHRDAMEHLTADLLRVIEGVKKQYEAFFGTFVERGEEARRLGG
ncbi:MAG: AAA family ATPase [Deltaproteobacteria bacterium]|nr:AAA family ATPase [Deltaproteobacteria bacterium]